LAQTISLATLFATAFLLSRAYVATSALEAVIDRAGTLFGPKPHHLLLACLVVVCASSVLLPNTVVALAFAPLLNLFVARFGYPDDRTRTRIATGFALAVIWGSNIGGVGSIVGSTSNVVLVAYLTAADVPGRERLDFTSWLGFGLPLVAIHAAAAGGLLLLLLRRAFARCRVLSTAERLIPPGAPHHAHDQASVFRATALFVAFWLAHTLLAWLAGRAAAAAAACLFSGWLVFVLFFRRGAAGRPLMTPRDVVAGVPWRGVALVAAAALLSLLLIRHLSVDVALARMADAAQRASTPDWGLILLLLLAVTLLTELASNIVVALAAFPIAHEAALALELDPLPVLITVSLMSTFAFVSPIAAAANALVVGEVRGFRFLLMACGGLVLSLFAAPVLTVFALHVIPRFL
jgi:sodium-dependent dicarboxylate transporter 2/3/5